LVKFNSPLFLVVISFIFVIFYSYILFLPASQQYYTYDMPLGPLSKNNISFMLYLITIFIIIILILRLRRNTFNIMLYVLTLIIALFVKYFLPQYFDFNYFENFYDAGGHMLRGTYVTLTGFSNTSVDTYFDLQPGFFWWTAIFINTAYGTPVSPQDYIFLFMIKWFDIIILSIYLPILISFFRIAKFSARESFIGFTLFILFSLSRFHYSAQVYSYALYWLALEILLRMLLKENRIKVSNIIALVLIFASIIVVHQGISLFTFTTLFALLIGIKFPLPKLRIDRSVYINKPLIAFISIFSILWFSYLGYLTVYTFGSFVETVKFVILSLMDKGVINIVLQSIERPYPLWYQIVLVKAIYMLLLVSLSIIILLVIIFRKNKYEQTFAKTFIFISVILVSIIGIITLTLGGAGYTERIPETLSPIIAYSLLKTFQLRLKKLSSLLLIILCILGGTLYFAGWNFQSIAYSEASGASAVSEFNFILLHGLNTAGIYSNTCSQSLFYPIFPYNPIHNCLYIETRSNNIQAIYYLIGDTKPLEEINYMLTLNFNLIYSTPTTTIYQK